MKEMKEEERSHYVFSMCKLNNPKFKVEFTTNDMEKFKRVQEVIEQIIAEEDGCNFKCSECPDALFDMYGNFCICEKGRY